MMNTAILMIALIALSGAAVLVGREPDLRRARRLAILGAAIAFAAGLLFFAAPAPDPQPVDGILWWALPAFVSLIGLVAVSMSPIRDMAPATLVHTLTITALTVAAVGIRQPLVTAGLWALTALPAWLALRRLPANHGAARAFALYMVPSAVLILLGTWLLSQGPSATGLVLLSLGCAVRAAIVPFHSWLPDLVERVPLGLAVAFVAPQLGVYPFLLLSEHLPPVMTIVCAGLGAVTAVYAAVLGASQSRTRRALAYLLMSKGGLILLGLSSLSAVGRTGAILMWMVIGLAAAGLAMAIAALESRRGQLSLDSPTGSYVRMPRLVITFLLFGFACVGLPGSIDFVAEDLVVQGITESFPLLGFIMVVATAFNAISLVRTFFLLFIGTADHAGERDLVPRETLVFTVILVLLIVAGLFPGPVLESLAGHRLRHQVSVVSHPAYPSPPVPVTEWSFGS